MREIVIDASVLAKFVLKEPGWRDLADYILSARSVSLVASEVANAVWKTFHRGLIDRDDARAKLEALATLLHTSIETEDEVNLLSDAFEIALSANITVYDALYIALAKKLPNGVLVTSDAKQYEACLKAGADCRLV